MHWQAVVLVLVGLIGAALIYWFVQRELTVAETSQVSSLLSRAEESYNQASYTEALRLYQEVLDHEPERTEAYLGMADIYLLKNYYGQAEEILLLGRSAGADPRRIAPKLGEVAYQADDYEAAIDYWAGKDLPLSYQLKLVHSYLLLGRVADAKDFLEVISKKDSDQYGSNYYLAMVYLIDDPGAARESISRACEARVNEEGHSACLSIKEKIDRVRQASTKIRRESLKGYLYLDQGYGRLAEKVLKPVTEQSPAYRDGWVLLGASYLVLDEYDLAEDSLQKAVEIDPNHGYTYYLRARLKEDQGQNEKARGLYQSAIAYEPGRLAYYRHYLALLDREGDYSKMEEILEKVIGNERFSREEKRYYRLELAYLSLDHLGKLQRGLQVASEFKGAEVYAWALHKNENSAKALEILQSIEEAAANPNSTQSVGDRSRAWFYYHLGEVQSELGYLLDAQESYQRAVDLDTQGEVTELLRDEVGVIQP